MHTVISSDKIFATVTACGRTILTTTFEGMSSIEEVMRKINSAARGLFEGIATLIVRNGSQGWTVKRAMKAASRRVEAPVQLTLF